VVTTSDYNRRQLPVARPLDGGDLPVCDRVHESPVIALVASGIRRDGLGDGLVEPAVATRFRTTAASRVGREPPAIERCKRG
jgi:hypothetical protein